MLTRGHRYDLSCASLPPAHTTNNSFGSVSRSQHAPRLAKRTLFMLDKWYRASRRVLCHNSLYFTIVAFATVTYKDLLHCSFVTVCTRNRSPEIHYDVSFHCLRMFQDVLHNFLRHVRCFLQIRPLTRCGLFRTDARTLSEIHHDVSLQYLRMLQDVLDDLLRHVRNLTRVSVRNILEGLDRRPCKRQKNWFSPCFHCLSHKRCFSGSGMLERVQLCKNAGESVCVNTLILTSLVECYWKQTSTTNWLFNAWSTR